MSLFQGVYIYIQIYICIPNTSVNDIIKGFPCNDILFHNAELCLFLLGCLISLDVLSPAFQVYLCWARSQ